MYRGMVFCDHSNFQIAVKQYYGGGAPKLDYNMLFKNIVHLVPNVDFMRAVLAIPRPDDECLRTDNELSRMYHWESGLSACHRVEIIEGDLRISSKYQNVEIDYNNRDTYIHGEKGVDISLAIKALSMAYSNAYDVAFIMSADSDFNNLYDLLRSLGKIVYVVAVCGQNLSRVRTHIDEIINLDKNFFNTCLR